MRLSFGPRCSPYLFAQSFFVSREGSTTPNVGVPSITRHYLRASVRWMRSSKRALTPLRHCKSEPSIPRRCRIHSQSPHPSKALAHLDLDTSMLPHTRGRVPIAPVRRVPLPRSLYTNTFWNVLLFSTTHHLPIHLRISLRTEPGRSPLTSCAQSLIFPKRCTKA